jgi:UrcA family protein
MNYARALAACGASLVAAVAIGVTASPAHSSPPGALVVVANPADYVIRHVTYADLNLASAPGERTLNRRVSYAVTDLCNEALGEPSSSSNTFAYKECTGGAWHGADPQIAAAVQRAHEIAATGTSSIAVSAITISVPE